EEGRKVLAVMAKYGLRRGREGLKVYVMCEIPSNILRADEFLDAFDGMSIGSNDLTQLVLGLDRDAGTLTHIGNEKDESVKQMIAEVIQKCRKRKKYIGICGQAPSDYPEFAVFLERHGIGSISLNPDTVMKFLMKRI
ncbi:MAG: phosphoenolpyruvate synthase, partial [Deltaproteobacteria bacterium]|nr:phosphoenolpyruvate synthase [Deltaproteobacteria bacterium]